MVTTVKCQVPKDCKDGDRALSRLQALILDDVGPLTGLLELKQAGRLTPEAAVDAATQALRFMGNANSHISTERRKRVVGFLNKDLRPLAEEPERFESAAPFLFGKEFEKEAKDHVDSVKSLRKPTNGPPPQRSQFFRQGRPHNYAQAAREGGAFRGSSSRGSARGRFRPYSKENRPPKGGGNN